MTQSLREPVRMNRKDTKDTKEVFQMRRLTALLLILALLLGIASTASAKKAKILDIYWIGNQDDETIRKGVEQAINEYVEPLIGVNVSFHIVNWDDWEEKAVKPLLEGEKVDLIFTADWRDYVKEITEGALLPLGDQLDKNGRGILETLPETFLEGVKYKGVVYGIPTNKELCVPTGLIVNRTAAALIGWDPDSDPVTSTEELEPWLAKYREKFPGRYPYLMENGRWPDEPWCPDWIGIEGNAVAMKMARNEDGEFDETVWNIYDTPEQEAHIRLMYKWAQAGYIAPDAVTYPYNRIFGTGDFLAFTQPLKGNNIKTVEMLAANKDKDLPDFECTEIILQPKYVVTTHAGGSMFAIARKSRYKDQAMQFLNLMHSDPTLVNLMLYGKEGVNYRKVNDQQVELIGNANWYGLHGGAWTVGNTKLQYVLTTEDPEKNALLQSFADDAIPTASLGFRFIKDPVSDKIDAVNKVVREMCLPLMCGSVDPDDPEKGIEAARRALKEAGIDDVIEEVKNQYAVWKDSLS